MSIENIVAYSFLNLDTSDFPYIGFTLNITSGKYTQCSESAFTFLRNFRVKETAFFGASVHNKK